MTYMVFFCMSFLSKQDMLTGDVFTTATVVVAVVSKSLRLAVQKLGRNIKRPVCQVNGSLHRENM